MSKWQPKYHVKYTINYKYAIEYWGDEKGRFGLFLINYN